MEHNRQKRHCVSSTSTNKKVTYQEDPYIRSRIIHIYLKKWLDDEISYKEMKDNVDTKVKELVGVS